MTGSEVSQIKIGKHLCGFVGLQSAIDEMAAVLADASDERVAAELVKRLSKKNYIPDNVRGEYGRAFVREFRKRLGQPYAADKPSGALEIKVLGAGCRVCDSLENDLMELLAEMGLAADLEHVRDPAEIARYGAKATPAVVINGKVRAAGGALSRKQLRKWIEAAGGPVETDGPDKKETFIKNISPAEPRVLVDLVDYAEGQVVSRTFAQKPGLSLTLFAFDAGEGLSPHTAPGDAMVQVLEGQARVTIGNRETIVSAGQVIVLPANVPHALTAGQRFKMLLTLVK